MSSLGPDGRMLGPIFTYTGYRWVFNPSNLLC